MYLESGRRYADVTVDQPILSPIIAIADPGIRLSQSVAKYRNRQTTVVDGDEVD